MLQRRPPTRHYPPLQPPLWGVTTPPSVPYCRANDGKKGRWYDDAESDYVTRVGPGTSARDPGVGAPAAPARQRPGGEALPGSRSARPGRRGAQSAAGVAAPSAARAGRRGTLPLELLAHRPGREMTAMSQVKPGNQQEPGKEPGSCPYCVRGCMSSRSRPLTASDGAAAAAP